MGKHATQFILAHIIVNDFIFKNLSCSYWCKRICIIGWKKTIFVSSSLKQELCETSQTSKQCLHSNTLTSSMTKTENKNSPNNISKLKSMFPRLDHSIIVFIYRENNNDIHKTAQTLQQQLQVITPTKKKKKRSFSSSKDSFAAILKQKPIQSYSTPPLIVYSNFVDNQPKKIKLPVIKQFKNCSQTIDLHGLYVHEALELVKAKLEFVNRGGKLKLITGVGNHSKDHRPRIRPAVLRFLKRQKIYRIKEDIPGQLLIRLK